MNILLVGGGSGGPVSPLIAVFNNIKQTHPNAKFLFVGGKTGPEQDMVKVAKIDFVAINAPKLRRYFSWQNFLIPFLFIVSFWQALKIIKDFKPDCIFGAGSFIQVPVIYAGFLKGVPIVVHQQDVSPSLANILCQLFAKKITVTFSISLKKFFSGFGFFYKKGEDKVIVTGNPFRSDLLNATKEDSLVKLNLKKDLPVLLVLGGGTGAEFLNRLVWDCLPALAKTVQIIHITGKGKFNSEVDIENYHSFEFLNDMKYAYAASDIVLCRAGLSTITELSNLGKLSIIVPMPNSHQELNALYLKRTQSAIVLEQNRISLTAFVNFIRKLIFSH
jgi:UDP-N-acetylglucosamine--N-acetylmuramyl-(pentapeptide) pyrophosphoryl-undecaprenol N-acetylglucosamine transferase